MLTRVRAKNLLPGGKSLSGDRKHSPVVQVRVSEHTRDKLQAIAMARGMSVSKLSRKVLDEICRTRDSWVIYACFGSAGAVDRDLKGSADLAHPGVGKSAKSADQDCD